MAGEIKITVLRCGTMSVLPYQADIRRKNPLARRVELPVNVFLIRHPAHGNILIDTGWSADVCGILPAYLKDFYRPKIGEGETAREQLEKMGILPEDIDLVLLSHLDVDHTCALRDFAGRAKRTVCSELEYFYSCRYVYKARQVWDTWMPYITNEEDRLCYRASVLGPAGRGFDIFGDDSVICIYTPGHTDGNFTTLVNQSPSDRFKEHGDGRYGGEFAVIAGDTAFSRRNLDEMSVPGYGFDRRMQLRSIEFLKKLEADRNCRAILFSHSTPDNSEIILK